MKKLMMALGLSIGLFGSAVASDACGQECGDGDLIALDSGESTALLYAATENEIKGLFVQAVQEGWSAEQFAAACSQLVEQMHLVRKPAKSDVVSWVPIILLGVAGVVIAGIAGGLVHLERTIARLDTTVTQEAARTRAVLNHIGRNVAGQPKR